MTAPGPPPAAGACAVEAAPDEDLLLLRVMDATWPPAFGHRTGPWTIREGQGGGSRVSAATADAPWTEDDIAGAETAMGALGQRRLFMIRRTDGALDASLGTRGYGVLDPVVLMAAPSAALADAPGPMTTFPHWPPLAIALSIWAEGGIGPERLRVMHRAPGPKTAILGRTGDRAAGMAFVACAGEEAMIHAVAVVEASRRRGMARNLVLAAARWAEATGARRLSLAVTAANVPARALYASLGMVAVGSYHYRTS